MLTTTQLSLRPQFPSPIYNTHTNTLALSAASIPLPYSQPSHHHLAQLAASIPLPIHNLHTNTLALPAALIPLPHSQPPHHDSGSACSLNPPPPFTNLTPSLWLSLQPQSPSTIHKPHTNTLAQPAASIPLSHSQPPPRHHKHSGSACRVYILFTTALPTNIALKV